MVLNSAAYRVVAVLAAVSLIGCGSNKKKPEAAAPVVKRAIGGGPLDVCANRLHDISGLLLQYYLINKRMPASLSDLAKLADADQPAVLTCPASGKPYIYDPVGFQVPDKAGVVSIYDPEPSHDGVRWAITLEQTGSVPTTKVVGIPETDFAKRHQ